LYNWKIVAQSNSILYPSLGSVYVAEFIGTSSLGSVCRKLIWSSKSCKKKRFSANGIEK
jgi:hypothetical protein